MPNQRQNQINMAYRYSVEYFSLLSLKDPEALREVTLDSFVQWFSQLPTLPNLENEINVYWAVTDLYPCKEPLEIAEISLRLLNSMNHDPIPSSLISLENNLQMIMVWDGEEQAPSLIAVTEKKDFTPFWKDVYQSLLEYKKSEPIPLLTRYVEIDPLPLAVALNLLCPSIRVPTTNLEPYIKKYLGFSIKGKNYPPKLIQLFKPFSLHHTISHIFPNIHP